MPTKVTRLTETAQTEKKKIEFKHCLLSSGQLTDTPNKPESFTNIVLLRHGNPYDVFYAYCGGADNGCVYLGHFNDGVV